MLSLLRFLNIFFMGIHCLRDDFVEFSSKVAIIGPTLIVFLSHILFVSENLFMILIMRICLLRWLSKKPAGGSPAASSGDVNACVAKYYVSSV